MEGGEYILPGNQQMIQGIPIGRLNNLDQRLKALESSSKVTSVSNSDGTLTISPITGTVIASLNLSSLNTWLTDQRFNTVTTFGNTALSGGSEFSISNSGVITSLTSSGTITLTTSGIFNVASANTIFNSTVAGTAIISNDGSLNAQLSLKDSGGSVKSIITGDGSASLAGTFFTVSSTGNMVAKTVDSTGGAIFRVSGQSFQVYSTVLLEYPIDVNDNLGTLGLATSNGTYVVNIGPSTWNSKLNVFSTSPGTTTQISFGYGSANRYDLQVDSNGLNFTGSTAAGRITFNNGLNLTAGTATAGTAPLRWTTGALLTAPAAGMDEFLTDKRYITINTGAARKEYTLNDIALTSGRISFNTTLGRQTDSSAFLFSTSTGLTLTDLNMVLGTTTGTKFGTATTQKLSFFNATPIVQVGATIDLGVVLSNLGLRAAGTAWPLTTSGAISFTGGLTLATTGLTITDVNVILSATTGTKFGTATTQKLAFWNAAPIVQPTNAIAAATFVANTSGIANDTATFDGYTLGQVVKALRNVGLLT